jgi:hypothetical protein
MPAVIQSRLVSSRSVSQTYTLTVIYVPADLYEYRPKHSYHSHNRRIECTILMFLTTVYKYTYCDISYYFPSPHILITKFVTLLLLPSSGERIKQGIILPWTP